ncbi:VOC family protein [Roseomonas terrae]|jgi:lactoylglutathione lyase|uniref:VOC family protein n=1 Tax=Neoroseomonas terrae TaxID=424799 RepID=A0ABS5EIW4_9PROT|nr:VOC family protein [Neoroseomonas terrae]MBR0650966.1 VOC family protein [Neoroseomonas terrae]
MKLGYVIHYVPDVAATVAFYAAAFGFAQRFAAEDGTYAEMDTGATVLAFASESMIEEQGASFRRTRPGETPPGMEIGLVTEDVRGAFATAVAAGAVPLLPPKEKTWGQTVGYVRDLNGALVEICSPMG